MGDFEALLKVCRAHGVLSFKQGDLEFTLLATDPDSMAPSTPQVEAAQPEAGVKREPKLGADGLTADMQRELLGRRMDAED